MRLPLVRITADEGHWGQSCLKIVVRHRVTADELRRLGFVLSQNLVDLLGMRDTRRGRPELVE